MERGGEGRGGEGVREGREEEGGGQKMEMESSPPSSPITYRELSGPE